MTQLFDRDGKERKPNGTDDKGRPVYLEHRPCLRCGGEGGSERWHYTGYKCYRCGGAGHDPAGPFRVPLYTAERLAKLNAIKAKRDAAKVAKQAAAAAAKREQLDAAWATWYEPNKPACDAILFGASFAGDFVESIARKLNNREPLSDHAIDVTLASVVRKLAEQDQRNASQHVGKVGERVELEVICEKRLRFDYGTFPTITTFINLCRDRAGNRIVYKGSNGMSEGEWMKLKATIKEHGEREGELQTLIARPKIIEEKA